MASPFFTGATDTELDDPQGNRRLAEAQRLGYVGTENVGATGDTSASPGWSSSGGGEEIKGGYKQGGTSAYDKSVDRYRQMGADRAGRGAATLDQGQAGQTRGLQLNALEMLRRQGSGEAPSAAAAVAQRANQNAALMAGQRATAARTTGGALAALRMSGGESLGANAANAGARAGEISQGQQGYAAGAGTLGGQDIGAATANANAEATQRALNQAAEQRFERLGWDTRNTQLQAGTEYNRLQHNEQFGINSYNDAKRQMEEEKMWGAVSRASGLGMGVFGAANGRR